MVYTGSCPADESPLEPGVFLLPAHSTSIEPPELAAPNNILVWSINELSWSVRCKEEEKQTDPWESLRLKRNQLLKDTDYMFVRDYPVSDIEPLWMAYRHALRNLPQSTSDPLDVVWPSAPGSRMSAPTV